MFSSYRCHECDYRRYVSCVKGRSCGWEKPENKFLKKANQYLANKTFFFNGEEV